MKKTELIKLNNGLEIPQIGFGTCKHKYEKPIVDCILYALECGYRYIDTASIYDTERDIREAIKISGINRREIILASKLWYDEYGYNNTKEACKRSLDRLGMEYIDIYFIHWPRAHDNDNWKETLKDTWRAMEDLKDEGLIKSIAVSNFFPHHMDVILKGAKVMPVIDQLEMHLGYFQEYVYRYLLEKNIKPQAWSPMCRGRDCFKDNDVLKKMAKKYNVSVQKLSLRYLNQRNIMILPWSTNKEHIKDNLNIYDFQISDEDMSMLSCMPQQICVGEHPDFNIPIKRTL